MTPHQGDRKMTRKEILELMHLRGWSQAEFARQIDVTEGTVSMWLSGQREPLGPARILMREWLDRAKKEIVVTSE